MPPETGSSGLGVMIALPTPTLNSACASEVNEHMRMSNCRESVSEHENFWGWRGDGWDKCCEPPCLLDRFLRVSVY